MGRDDEKNLAFAGLVSALGLMVVLVVITTTAIIVGVGTGSTLAGVLAFIAMVLTAGVCVWCVPGQPEE